MCLCVQKHHQGTRKLIAVRLQGIQPRIQQGTQARRANKLLNKAFNTLGMAIGVRVEPELELQLDQLARSMGKSRSACVREAIALYVQHFGGPAEAKRQSALIAAQGASAHWSEQVPDWGDWTA